MGELDDRAIPLASPTSLRGRYGARQPARGHAFSSAPLPSCSCSNLCLQSSGRSYRYGLFCSRPGQCESVRVPARLPRPLWIPRGSVQARGPGKASSGDRSSFRTRDSLQQRKLSISSPDCRLGLDGERVGERWQLPSPPAIRRTEALQGRILLMIERTGLVVVSRATRKTCLCKRSENHSREDPGGRAVGRRPGGHTCDA